MFFKSTHQLLSSSLPSPYLFCLGAELRGVMDHNEKIVDSSSDIDEKRKLQLENPGVQRIEAISSSFTLPLKVVLFIGVFLIAYVYGLGKPYFFSI